MGSLTRRTATTCAFALAACTGREPQRADSSPSVPPPVAVSSAPSIAAPVTELGIGALRIGMTIPEVRRTLGSFDVSQEAEKAGCDYGTVPGLQAGVRVMVENGIVVRVDVDSSNIATAEGARVGDSEPSVRTLYGKRLTVSPHKYTDGHYLTVKASSPSDTLHLIIFETNNSRIMHFRAGQRPQVEYVEGCS